MRLLVKVLFVLWIGQSLASLLTTHVLAANGFKTGIDSTYMVDANGQTTVSHVFDLTNTTARSYVKEYTLEITGSPITNVIATNKGEPLDPQIQRQGEKTRITLAFPDELVGEGQTRQFSIRYTSPDIAIMTGKILEVRIPGVAIGSEYEKRQVTLLTPKSYGQPVRITPQPSSVTNSDRYVKSVFKDLNNQAISVFFGQTQVYNLALSYQLENDRDRNSLQDIALPPDTPFQQVIYQRLDPPPLEMRSDLDGNWLATYLLKPGEKLNIIASASAKLSLERNPQTYDSPPQNGYTQAQPFWNLNDNVVVDATAKFNSVEGIYKFVSRTLSYPESLDNFVIKRRSASEILKQPKGSICQDFTDLFVTMMRSKGVPARRLTGYGYAQNDKIRPILPAGDILHAWPDFYDNTLGTWRSVDPTWENTTGGVDYFNQFDLSHIVFAINGESSQWPAPAGAYRLAGNNDQQVYVSPAKEFEPQKLTLKLDVVPDKWFFWSIPGKAKLEITNLTGQGWYDVSLEIKSNDPNITTQLKNPRLTSLLPYQKITIPLTFYANQNAFSSTGFQIRAASDTETVSQTPTTQFRSAPAWITQGNWQIYVIVLVPIGLVVALGAGSVLVYRTKQSGAVRRQGQDSPPPTPVVHQN